MDEKIRQKIEEIIGQMKCPKDFKCANNGFDRLCEARDVGLHNHLECLEDNPTQCKFALSFGYTYFCHCPLRIFIEKKLRLNGNPVKLGTVTPLHSRTLRQK